MWRPVAWVVLILFVAPGVLSRICWTEAGGVCDAASAALVLRCVDEMLPMSSFLRTPPIMH